MIESYPLHWPAGHRRTLPHHIQYSRFSPGNRAQEAQKVINEIDRLGGANTIVSTNIRLRNDGLPYARDKAPFDQGVAVYFNYQGGQKCFPCDRWTTVEDNLHAVFKSIEAIRGLERWGSKTFVSAAFTGFAALPAPAQTKLWWKVLGVQKDASLEDIQRAYRWQQAKAHKNGGNEERMRDLNIARDQGVKLK